MKRQRTLENEKYLESYLNKAVPVQWIAWWSELPLGKDKTEFATLLFENGRLRSLLDASVKTKVINFIKTNGKLRGIVLLEAQKTIDEIVATAKRK